MLLGGADPSAAATFTFSFTNFAEGGGMVRGIVSGLADEGASAAKSVRVTSNELGFGVGEYVGSPIENFFEVSEDQVRSFFFLSFGSLNAAPAEQCCSLALVSDPGPPLDVPVAGLSFDPEAVFVGPDSGITFVPIPLPAPIVMLGAALAVLAGLRLRRTTLQARVIQPPPSTRLPSGA